MADHRTYGKTRTCGGCRYWSEMIAQAYGSGPVRAMCLTPVGPLKGLYVSAGQSCTSWASGHDGAVDEPGADPLRYHAEDAAKAATVQPSVQL